MGFLKKIFGNKNKGLFGALNKIVKKPTRLLGIAAGIFLPGIVSKVGGKLGGKLLKGGSKMLKKPTLGVGGARRFEVNIPKAVRQTEPISFGGPRRSFIQKVGKTIEDVSRVSRSVKSAFRPMTGKVHPSRATGGIRNVFRRVGKQRPSIAGGSGIGGMNVARDTKTFGWIIGGLAVIAATYLVLKKR